MTKHWIDKALNEADRMTPASGYDVVGVDRFAMAGEALYLIAHFDTKPGAEACRDEHIAHEECGARLRASGQREYELLVRARLARPAVA
jgi:hypothetical protein